MKRIFLFLFAYLVICLFAIEPVRGQVMENGMYMIQEGDVSSFDPQINISNANLSNTSEQIKQNENYEIKSGTRIKSSQTPLVFSISNLLIDFGTLSPTNPVQRTAKLMVKNNSVYGYQVIASENHELTDVRSGAKIPDTTCDDGNCSEAVSGKWESTLAYGFGFRCDSKSSCKAEDESFNNKNYFKQFADSDKGEPYFGVLSGGPQTLKEASLTFKMNIPSSQPHGFYSNTLTFIAVPNY